MCPRAKSLSHAAFSATRHPVKRVGSALWPTGRQSRRRRPILPSKDPKDFVLIGKELPKLDTVAKSTGKAVFTLDVLADEMMVAVVRHPDHFGATVKSFDDAETRKVKGVVDVKQVGSGVAIYANDTYSALKGRDVLKVEWDLSKAETRSSAQLTSGLLRKARTSGLKATDTGNVRSSLRDEMRVKSLEADIVFPFLAHAPMEPLDAVFIPAEDGTIDVYTGAQFPGGDHKAAAKALARSRQGAAQHTTRRRQFRAPGPVRFSLHDRSCRSVQSQRW